MMPPAAAHQERTQQEWQWVHEMIDEIEDQERREDFARWLFQWDFAVREFRKVEQRRIVVGSPNEFDWRFHALCLHSLLATGNALILTSHAFDADDLKRFGVSHADIEAYVAELEQSFREWHHGSTDAEVAAAQKAIFGAAS